MLTKYTHGLYDENYKTLTKDIKDLNKYGELYHVHGLRDSIRLKMSILIEIQI